MSPKKKLLIINRYNVYKAGSNSGAPRGGCRAEGNPRWIRGEEEGGIRGEEGDPRGRRLREMTSREREGDDVSGNDITENGVREIASQEMTRQEMT